MQKRSCHCPEGIVQVKKCKENFFSPLKYNHFPRINISETPFRQNDWIQLLFIHCLYEMVIEYSVCSYARDVCSPWKQKWSRTGASACSWSYSGKKKHDFYQSLQLKSLCWMA